MLGELILEARHNQDHRKMNRLLGVWGVRWERASRMECLIVANHNFGLERLCRRHALGRGRVAAGAGLSFGCAPSKTCSVRRGVNSRGMIIPPRSTGRERLRKELI